GVMVIYDTAIYFMAVHTVIFVVLIGCLFHQCRYGSGGYIVPISYILLIVAALLDIANTRLYLWQEGICSKTVFLGLFVLHVIRIIKVVPKNYCAAVQAEKLSAELQSSRISLMLSQIKPHFLYNCISAISELCRKNPDKAREALADFSDYLRLNMESINCKELIHFSRELRHIEKYIKLEKMRFGDDLNIIYDIQVEDFFLPPLVVQPLVENAVKHGICMSENGGTVTIRTQRDGDKIIITISDDGVGFDVYLPLDKNEKHIGIQNVRKRLEYTVRGTLEIKSVKGEGTTAVISFLK
ncbi:MAG: sensor histidine kinase, partial [Lachnospirales bacterium]